MSSDPSWCPARTQVHKLNKRSDLRLRKSCCHCYCHCFLQVSSQPAQQSTCDPGTLCLRQDTEQPAQFTRATHATWFETRENRTIEPFNSCGSRVRVFV